MSREPINWAVEEQDVKEFIKPINIEIPIDKGQYGYIFNNNLIKGKKAKDYFQNLEKAMIEELYTNKNYEKYKRILYFKISLNFIPDFKNNNWVIGYSPVEIYNNIFETLNIDKINKYIDYSDNKLVNRTKSIIKLRLIEERLKCLKENNTSKLAFIEDSINAIDKLFLFNGFDIETRMKDCLVYKNLLYYLSVKSLDKLDETDNILYSYIPRQYYMEVSSKNKANWPNQLYMDDRVYSYNYKTYNDRFENVMFRYPTIFEEVLGIDEISVMERLEIVKADNFMSELESNYTTYKKKKTYIKTDKELSEMLMDKINFYKELLNLKDENDNNIVISPVKGKNDLYGYYGFVLNNNYIVLDKFYSINDEDKIKPSKDEAIYSMPLDLFVELGGSKKKMMQYIKDNPKGNVKRNYHTKKHTYKDNILKVTKKDDVSTMNSDWFLNIYSPKKLYLKKDNK
ncbi:MAG: hypothetical protein IJ105_04515 [Bacilli bacterium]|nr:hypothetical protein [Bacilli bacterium]